MPPPTRNISVPKAPKKYMGLSSEPCYEHYGKQVEITFYHAFPAVFGYAVFASPVFDDFSPILRNPACFASMGM